MMEPSKRQRLNLLKQQLEMERASFISHYRELGEYILPRRPRFTVNDINKGDRRNQKIIDSTATLALRTLRSGMMSGITSPARPWFRLTTPDPALAEFQSVKDWLSLVGQRMQTVFLKSNLYNTLPILYGDLGVFGTGAMAVSEDFNDVIRFFAFPIGSYSIGVDERLKVCTFIRDFRLTVRQVIQKFGRIKDNNGRIDWSHMSDYVKRQYETGNLESWVDVTHVISPNPEEDRMKLKAKFLPFASDYFERQAQGSYTSSDEGKFLRESGYQSFPVLCPRWEVTGEDIYGTDCPGMSALGDIKALQVMQKRKAQAIEKIVNPPMIGPASMKNMKVSTLPGDMNYYDEREGMKGFRPAQEVRISIAELMGDIQTHQQRISRAFYEDLFLMMAQSDRRQITAREIDERREEKLLALGPVLEQLNQDLLDPLIDATFNIMQKQGLIPRAPDELHGVPLRVEYISVMAQAQKTIGISSIERFVSFIGQAAQFQPAVLDKLDADQMVDVYGDLTSVPPGIVLSDEKTKELRDKKQQAQAQQAQAEQLNHSAAAVRNLAAADTSGDNALTSLMNAQNQGRIPQ